MAHEQIAFDLLEGVQDYAHHDQQRGAAEEGSELVVHTHHICQGRQTGDDGQEEGALTESGTIQKSIRERKMKDVNL